MASVVGMMEQARAFFPDFVARRRRGPAPVPSVHTLPDLRLASSQTERDGAASGPIGELIERAVVPQILEVHRNRTEDEAMHVADADAVAALAMEADAGELMRYVEVLLVRGVPVETVLIDMLAPAARRLGTMWEQDDCDFVDVTMGLWRLQELVRELSARVPSKGRANGGTARALFSAMPDDQHNFGTVIVEDVFRRAGWDSSLLPDGERSALFDALAGEHIDLLGLTVSQDAHTEDLPSLILAIRSVSRNPRLCILLGGRVLTNDPQLALRVGADGTAADAQSAVELADRLVTANACREVFTA